MPDRFTDPVVAEIHDVRTALLAAAGGDFEQWMHQVAERQSQSGRRVISHPYAKAKTTFSKTASEDVVIDADTEASS